MNDINTPNLSLGYRDIHVIFWIDSRASHIIVGGYNPKARWHFFDGFSIYNHTGRWRDQECDKQFAN